MLRFHLSEMRELNEHHNFEQVCFEVARARIASNIIPATGPVSSGGDQGRDFESFRSLVADNAFPETVFAAMMSPESLVFACTMQQDDVASKIRKDVRTIVSAGPSVDRVYVFLAVPLPVARRHELQNAVAKSHGVELEIFDLHAIADFLGDSDLFWVAEEFLRVPAGLAPEPELARSGPDWYQRLRHRWHERLANEVPAETFGDLTEIRRGLDRALFHSDARGDIDDWGRALRPLAESEMPRLRQLARYSIAVSRFRGGGTSDGDRAASDFFEELAETHDLGLLHDASVLHTYMSTAVDTGLSHLSFAQCEHWRVATLAICDELLNQEIGPNTTATLLATAAALSLKLDYESIRELRREPGVRAAHESEFVPPARYLGRDQLQLGSIPLDAPQQAMRYLSRLAELLPAVPQFPVDRIADLFDIFSEALIDLEGFNHVRSALDEAVDRAAGSAAVAERCQLRGRKLADTGRPLDALREFHEAKERRWKAGDAAELSIALLEISQVYYALNLAWAAKSYALASTVIAGRDGDPEILSLAPHGAFYASICEASVGAWRKSFEWLSVAARMYEGFDSNPWSNVQDFMRYAFQLHAGWYRVIAEQESVVAAGLVEQYSVLGVSSLLADMLAEDDSAIPVERDLCELVDRFSASSPSDIGDVLQMSWAAFGVRWVVKCENSEAATRIAERFCAIAQVALAEMASVDLLLLAVEVEIDIFVDEGDADGINISRSEREEGGSALSWRLGLHEYLYAAQVEDSNNYQLVAEILGALLFVLSKVSIHDADVFEEKVVLLLPMIRERSVAGRPYDELVSAREAFEFPELQIDPSSASAEGLPQWVSVSRQNEALPAITGDAEVYDLERSLELVRGRYVNSLKMVEISLRRVLENAESRLVLQRLREVDGWLDWHVLVAMANIVCNRRVEGLDLDSLRPEEVQELLYGPESENYVEIPLEDFSERNLKEKLMMSGVGTLQVWGKRVNLSPFDPNWVMDLLGDRFRYWIDDVPHVGIDFVAGSLST
jgi:hypothetical protein